MSLKINLQTVSICCMLTICGIFGHALKAQSIAWNNSIAFTAENIQKETRSKRVDTIKITDKVLVSENVETPKNIVLVFKPKGMLLIGDEEVKLKIQGPIVAKQQQIFDLSARGVATYDTDSKSNITLSGTKIFYPEWWGWRPNVIPTKSDGTFPNAVFYRFSKEMMLDIAASGGGTLQFDEGVYYMRDLLIDFNNITVRGKGKKTILRFDRDNFKYTTRRGGLFTIQGPTDEMYHGRDKPQGQIQSGNFLFDVGQITIENITVKDLAIEWDIEATAIDPSMNGLTIGNAKNVLIDNVHVNLFGANRAFYIGSYFDGDVTENVVIQNCTGINARSGVFINHGFDDGWVQRNNKSLGNITIQGNYFNVMPPPKEEYTNPKMKNRHLDIYATGFYFLGSEHTEDYVDRGIVYKHNIGKFLIKDNVIENADFGVRAWFGEEKEFKEFKHDITFEGNTFKNFRYTGIFSTFSTITITNNTFQSEVLTEIPLYIKQANQEGFLATAIHIAKAPRNEFSTKDGVKKAVIEGNTFSGCYLNAVPIRIQPTETSDVQLQNNTFVYDETCQKPSFDIVVTTNRRWYRTKKATIVVGENFRTDTFANNKEEVQIKKDTRNKKHITIIHK